MMPGFASAEAAYLEPPPGWTAKEEDQIEAATNGLLMLVLADSGLSDLLESVPNEHELSDDQRATVIDNARDALTRLLKPNTKETK